MNALENNAPGKKLYFPDNLILDVSFKFSLAIIELAELLEANRKFVIANQVLRSGTSIGANVREAQGAESKADFTHKMKIAYKEAEETEYFLLLCKHSVNYPDTTQLLQQVASLKKILGKIISSSKK
jgi:four helix bundle protein